ncbi:NYN domain-containing protein [Tissierella creatinophila]|uniref:NYN domain-containing protein n=1 Tax=Tissierella creatinophila TaxID=79681 RepID=UPI0009519AE6|nr:NYN domain-containing protein [Tissierella creatinophila]
MAEDKKFAVLIDADNVSARYIKYIMDEISNYGVATYKRIYGDWTKPNAGSWKEILLENSITPVQQYGYTVGKNATDSAMIIDAMDILYSNHVDGFCIVSSDSDFTKLASRLRESGMLIVGMGEKKTPKPFIAACNQFKYLDVLASTSENTQSIKTSKKTDSSSNSSKSKKTDDEEEKGMTDINVIKAAIIKMINESDSENQSINMAELGNRLAKRYPDFDVRNYGDTKLSRFLKKMEFLKIESDKSEGNSIWVSLKSDEDIEPIKTPTIVSKKGKNHYKKK